MPPKKMTENILRAIFTYRKTLINNLNDIIDSEDNLIESTSSIGELLVLLDEKQKETIKDIEELEKLKRDVWL